LWNVMRRSVELPVDTKALWEALTEADRLAGWFGGEFTEWSPEAGFPLRWRSNEGDEREGRVEAVRPERYLRFTWWRANDPYEASEVSYLLEHTKEGTRLTVQERPLAPEASASASGHAWTSWDSRLARAWARASVARVKA
jgi:uncharacterized protein YndB with AHSA1/START domain